MLEERREKHKTPRTVLDHIVTRTMVDFQLVCLVDFHLVGFQEQPKTLLDHIVIRTILKERREKQDLIFEDFVCFGFVTRIM